MLGLIFNGYASSCVTSVVIDVFTGRYVWKETLRQEKLIFWNVLKTTVLLRYEIALFDVN